MKKKKRQKQRALSMSLIVIALMLIIGIIGFKLISKVQDSGKTETDTHEIISIENDNTPDTQNDSTDAVESQIEEQTKNTLFDSFLAGDIDAYCKDEEGEEYTLNISELDLNGGEWDSYSVYGYLDVDNDGEDELLLTGGYGLNIFDASNDKVSLVANGYGSAVTCLFAYYDNAYWIVYAGAGADWEDYSFSKYNSADNLVESFNVSAEINENGEEMYYKTNANSSEDNEISAEEYKAIVDSIQPLN